MILHLIHRQIYNNHNYYFVHKLVAETFIPKPEDNTKTYIINVNAPLKTIMEYILNHATIDFQMGANEVKELVEAGQCIPDVKSEDAPALELDYPDETFKQRFGNSYQCVAFYIRKAT